MPQGTSPAAIWRRAHPEEARKKSRDALYKYLEHPTNRLKQNARCAVYRALKRGNLVRPSVCSNCSASCKPEADHHDYAKPLEVTWLCNGCHVTVTIQRRK